MMEIVCDKCGKKYRIDENKIKGKKARVKCKVCENIIVVVKPEPEEFQDSEFTFAAPTPSEPEIPQKVVVDTVIPPVRDYTKEEDVSKPPDVETPVERPGGVSLLNTIQARISIILVIITTLILFGFVVYNYFAAKSKMETELNNFARITSTRLSKYLVEPLWGVDEKQIEDAFNSEMMEKRIYGIVVIDRDTNKVFLAKKRDINWNIIKAKGKITGDLIKSSRKIRRDKEVLGDVEIYVTPKFIRQELNQSIINTAITAVILDIAIFLAVYIILRQIIIRPIMKLTDIADRMSMGDLNAEIDIKSKNEIGLLAQAVVRMQTSLRLALKRLRRKR